MWILGIYAASLHRKIIIIMILELFFLLILRCSIILISWLCHGLCAKILSSCILHVYVGAIDIRYNAASILLPVTTILSLEYMRRKSPYTENSLSNYRKYRHPCRPIICLYAYFAFWDINNMLKFGVYISRMFMSAR
jgi:hypothetical protein